MRLSVPLALLLLSLPLAADIWGNSDRYKEDFSYDFKLAPGGRLEVESFNGSVEVVGWVGMASVVVSPVVVSGVGVVSVVVVSGVGVVSVVSVVVVHGVVDSVVVGHVVVCDGDVHSLVGGGGVDSVPSWLPA